MEYELAKQLKEAGFPQEKYFKGRILVSPDFPYPPSPVDEGKIWMEEHKKYTYGLAYKPILSELINECIELNHDNTFRLENIKDNVKWFAEMFNFGTLIAQTDGSTPEIAVANLWLELHK